MNIPEFNTATEAHAAGYISIEEAIELRPASRVTYFRQAQSGAIPACRVLKKSRPVWFILASALQQTESGTRKKSYEQLEKDFLAQMKSGAFTGHQNSEKYVNSTLKWGLKRYWTLLGINASIGELNARNFDRVMSHSALAVDEIQRRDFYSTRMHIYRACTRFTDYLIQEGFKVAADRTAYKLPKRRFKPQKRMPEEEQIQEAIQFNRTWLNGRSRYDMAVMDVLIHLYAFTGLRRVEPASIKIQNVNFKTNMMLVYRKGGKEGYVRIDLFPALKPRLQQWIQTERLDHPTDLLLTQQDGTPLTEGVIKDRFQRFNLAIKLRKAHEKLAAHIDWLELPAKERRKKAEALAKTMKNVARPHDFRRSFATVMAKRGMPMTMIQLLLAHEHINTTEGYILTNIQHVMEYQDSHTAVLSNKKAQANVNDNIAAEEDEFTEALFQAVQKMQ
jgi:integrase